MQTSFWLQLPHTIDYRTLLIVRKESFSTTVLVVQTIARAVRDVRNGAKSIK